MSATGAARVLARNVVVDAASAETSGALGFAEGPGSLIDIENATVTNVHAMTGALIAAVDSASIALHHPKPF